MAEIEEIRQLVQDAVNQGATTVEDVQKKIAAMPLGALRRFGPLQGAADAYEATTGQVYDTIRMVNDQVGTIASDMLKNVDPRADSNKDRPPPAQ